MVVGAGVLSEASSCTGLAGGTSSGAVCWSAFLWPLHVAWVSLQHDSWVSRGVRGSHITFMVYNRRTCHSTSATFYWLEVSY